jgi:hypothetical protein
MLIRPERFITGYLPASMDMSPLIGGILRRIHTFLISHTIDIEQRSCVN